MMRRVPRGRRQALGVLIAALLLGATVFSFGMKVSSAPPVSAQATIAPANFFTWFLCFFFKIGCTGTTTTTRAGTTTTVPAGQLRDILVVGNGVVGTVSFIDGRTFQNLGSLNIIPDKDARIAEIRADFVRSIAYDTVKGKQKNVKFEPGVGDAAGDRFIDDLAVTPDGRTLIVSRSNLGDVAAFDLTKASHPILWRTRVSGFKSDHATLSPDGTKFVVSSTSNDVAEVMDARTGAIIRSFPTGHYPHQNDYTGNGRHIVNTSIGDVNMPYADNWLKGNRQLTMIDANTYAPVKSFSFDYGIRPNVITDDESIMYAQFSYLNGVAKVDMSTGKIIATNTQPLSAFAQANFANFNEYPHDSAHHGLAMSGDKTKLCDAGTIDNTVQIIAVPALTVTRTINTGKLMPYWATTSVDGQHCFMSNAGANDLSVINYNTGTVVATVPTGRYPQRSKLAKIPANFLTTLSPLPG